MLKKIKFGYIRGMTQDKYVRSISDNSNGMCKRKIVVPYSKYIEVYIGYKLPKVT